MSEHPIDGLMNSAMNSIKEMIDVNTIIGEPIETTNNVVIIPVSRVNFGFAAGGSEFNGKYKKDSKDNKENNDLNNKMPFGGGAGAGVSISPIAFIAVQESGVKLLPVEHNSSLDKLMDYIPDLMDRISNLVKKRNDKIKFEKNNIKDIKNDNKNEKVDIEYDETDM